MPGSGVLNIRDWRTRLATGKPMAGTTPLEIAQALDGAAAETLASVGALRDAYREDPELRKMAVDCEALAWLGRYYAAKIRGACDLALYDLSGEDYEQRLAVQHLENALEYWKRYAEVRDAHYVPALYNRVGYVNVTALTEQVAGDIEIARKWAPGGLKDEGWRQGTERGFRP